MEKIRDCFFQHRFFFGILFFILGYEFIVVGKCSVWKISEIVYPFYALDYSIGFASRILPGAFVHLLFPDIDSVGLSILHTVLIVLFFGIVAFLLEKIILSVPEKYHKLCLWLFFFFLSGPCTFSVFIIEIGMIEVFWLYLTALFFFAISFRPLAPFAVPICGLALLVNSSAIVCFVPFYCILLLYKASLEEKKSTRKFYFSVFACCCIVSIPMFLYFVLFGKNNMNYSYEQFHDLMLQKGITYNSYTEYYLYNRIEGVDWLEYFKKDASIVKYVEYLSSDSSKNILLRYLANVIIQIKVILHYTVKREWINYFVAGILLSPVCWFLLGFFIKEMRNKNNNNLRRFVFFCVVGLFFLSQASGILLSLDHSKWLAFSVLILFACFLYVLYKEKTMVLNYLSAFFHRLSFEKMVLFAAVYSVTFFLVYV